MPIIETTPPESYHRDEVGRLRKEEEEALRRQQSLGTSSFSNFPLPDKELDGSMRHEEGMEPASKLQTPTFLEFAPEPESRYNTAQIRKLMTDCFGDMDLKEISFDYFRPAYERFGDGMGKDQKIHILLEYADRYKRMDDLLLVLKEENQNCYQEHGVYISPSRRVTIDEKLVRVITEEEDSGKITKSIADRLDIPQDQVWPVIIQPKITVVSPFNRKADQLLNYRHSQFGKYNVEIEVVTDTTIRLALGPDIFPDEEIGEFKNEVARRLNVDAKEIYLEYSGNTLITIALPGEKADRLLRLDREGKLEEWKRNLKIKQLKQEDNLDRYIQIVANLTPSFKTSLLKEADELKAAIANEININPKKVRLVTWIARVITFTLVLPEQVEVHNLENLGIQDARLIHIGNGEKVIFGTLISKDGNSLSQDVLAHKLVYEIADSLRVTQDKIKIYWHHDDVSFTFVLPSKLAAIVFQKHATGQLKKFLDFEIQDLRIDQYDWDNYLGLVPVTAG